METMYDRLGELLNETLEAGEVKFVKVEVEEKKPENPQNESSAADNKDDMDRRDNLEEKLQKSDAHSEQKEKQRKNARPEYHRPENTGTIYHAEDLEGSADTREYKPRSFIYKKITPELEKAYRLLDMPFDSTMDDLKKAYKEKLKYYHPDRHTDNETLQKIATDKTRQVVESYNMIVKFLEE